MNIYVGNLAWGATEEEVRQAFGQYGDVSSVNIITDRETGRSRGFAFVEMPNDDEARDAIDNLHDTDLGGRPINVNEARPRERRGGAGGGGGGGGGGRSHRNW